MVNEHKKFMKIALNLSKRGVGVTASNPSVGCVLVKDNQIISTGITAIGGRPHAEVVALTKAGNKAQGATAYVTLEPCSHYGKTPPCADALIEAGVDRVVIATKDTCAKVAGGGVKKLEDAGVQVVMGVCEEEARQVNEGFFSVHEKERPYVTLKLATSSNGKIADKEGNSKWITGEDTRKLAHYIRAKNDAIMVGVGTVIADDPMLNCRLNGMEEQSPIRVVLDNNFRIPVNSKLVKTANEIPTYVICSADADSSKLESSGIEILKCNGEVNVPEVLQMLAKQGITRLMVEGGSKVAASFVKENLVDELVWMKAKKMLDDDGISAIGGMEISDVVKSGFEKSSENNIGDDIIFSYKPLKPTS